MKSHRMPGNASSHRLVRLAVQLIILIAVAALPLFRAAAQPVLECTAAAPVIVGDNANVRYQPMPFPVTLTVKNTGTALANPVAARIIVPPDLKLAGDDAPDGFSKPLEPFWLFPQDSGQVQWLLRHPPTTMEKQYVVQVWVKAPNADSVLCETTVIIPPLDSPILAPRCYVPDSLHFDDAADSYVPNPFTLRLTCVNNGNTPAEDVTGTLILPPDVELVDPTDSLTKHFDPSTLEKWRIGDPVPELTWLVRWVPRLRYEVQPEFRFTVTGMYVDSLRLDSTEVRCHMRVPGLVPMFGGCIKIPDSLGLNAAGTDVTPNPFTVRYPVRNISHVAGGLRRVYISFPPDGLTLNPSSPWPISSSLDTLVAPGDSIVFEWVIDVTNRITRRNVLIQVTVIDDEGNPIMCEDWLPIANLRTGLWEMLTSDVSALRYDPVPDRYDPEKFTVTATLRNTGGANLNEVVAEVEWMDTSGQDLIEFDPEYRGDNSNPKTRGVLFPGQEAEFVWGFRLKNRNTTGTTQYAVFNVKYGSRETPYIPNGCETSVEIDPVTTTAICDVSSPGDFILFPNHPNPFTASTIIRFSLPHAVPVTLTIVDALGREQRRLLDGEYRQEGIHSLALDGSGMLPGIYFVRMTVGETVHSRRMILVR